MSDRDAKPKANGAESLSTVGLERMFRVEKFDHPDFVGGIVWADGELRWINERITLAVLAEREACAMACEAEAQGWRDSDAEGSESLAYEDKALESVARAIRMRSNQSSTCTNG